MKHRLIVITTLLLSAVPLSVKAETYSWTDENGTINFSEDPSGIPKKFRKKVRILGDSTTKETPPAAANAKETDSSNKAAATAPPAPSAEKLYDGKTYAQWKQEFTERETAIQELKKSIDEFDSKVRIASTTRDNLQQLLQERNKTVEQYNELRAQYDQRIEVARKAGINITLK